MNKTYGPPFQDNLSQCQRAICEIICLEQCKHPQLRIGSEGLIKHPALKLLQTTSLVRISSIVLFAFKGFNAQVLVKVGSE